VYLSQAIAAANGMTIGKSWEDDQPAQVFKGVIDLREVMTYDAAAKASAGVTALPDGRYDNGVLVLAGFSFAMNSGTAAEVSPGTFVIRGFKITNDDGSGTVVEPPKEDFDANNTPASWARNNVLVARGLGLEPESIPVECLYRQPIDRLNFCRIAVQFIEAVSGLGIDDFIAQYEGETFDLVFEDCNDPAVLAAAKLGIVIGTSAGVFSPGRTIDRQSSARMLALTAKALGVDVYGKPDCTLPDFNKSDAYPVAYVSSWAKPYVNWVFDQEIMTGTGSGIFAPQAAYTTETSITTFLRMYAYVDWADYGYEVEQDVTVE
jgi:hypothetical protein